MTKTKVPGTVEAWESGELGESLEHARVASSEHTAEIQDAAGLQMISIRLPKTVIEDFKVISQFEGLGYQPLMRIALTRFAECEAKRLMREYAAKLANDKRLGAEPASGHRTKRVHADPRLEKKAA